MGTPPPGVLPLLQGWVLSWVGAMGRSAWRGSCPKIGQGALSLVPSPKLIGTSLKKLLLLGGCAP